MRIRQYLGALLIAASPFSTAYGQARTPSLQEADRAFADALQRHDRAAFVALFALDAECSLPSLKRGPEAIANAWLPFLIDPGTTMVLTHTGATLDTSGETGSTTGTLAIRGRTNNGVQTIPAGNYSIAWRLVDGHWRISALDGSSNKSGRTADRGGVGRFRFGMTRGEVSQVPDCQPYTSVAVTGGLECPHYLFDGREMNISFIFGADGLRRIQLWVYEGTSDAEAREAVGRVLDYLQRTTGGVTVAAWPGTEVTADRVLGALGAPPQPGRIAHVEISTSRGSQPEVWFSRVGRHQYGYGVMLFADAPDGR
jgi:ketosteroid isomerase-like protein